MELTWDEALDLGLLTLRLGPCQMSVWERPEQNSAYLINWITLTEHRRQGWAKRMLDVVVWLADVAETTLMTHAETPWLSARLLEPAGFVAHPEQPDWDGRPFYVRYPQQPVHEHPADLAALQVIVPKVLDTEEPRADN